MNITQEGEDQKRMETDPLTVHLTVILEKMFSYSPINFYKELVEKEDWYWAYTWKDGEKEDFINWLTDYLFNNKEAREQLMFYPTKQKDKCFDTARTFESMFGWREEIKKDEE